MGRYNDEQAEIVEVIAGVAAACRHFAGNTARAPYFHNGIAANLTEAVRHYEVALGFEYMKQEREDLVAFLEAL